MIYLFNNNEEMIRIIPNSAIKRMYQTQKLTDENYISDRLDVEIQALNDEELSELEYMAIDDIENPQRFHYYFIAKETTEHQTTSLTGVQSGIEELRKTPVYDMRPTNLSPKLIADRLLEGTNWQAGYTTDDVGAISTNFYYTDVFTALKKMCMAFGIEMQFFVEITTNRIGARYIEFRKRTGKSVGKRVVYGHNALKIVKEVEKTNTVTALIGRGKGVQVSVSDEGNIGYGRKIGFENVEWKTSSGAPVDKPLGQEFVEIPELTLQYGIKNSNGTVRPKIGFVEFQDEESETRLIDRTYQALLELSRPQVLLETSSVYLPDTGIGDTINVVRHDRDLRYQTRVFEITWDRLANKAVDMKLGDRLGESENKRISRISNQVSGSISTELGPTIDELVDRLTTADGKNTNWYTDYDPMENPETMGLVRVNDNWYQPDPEYEGEFILKQWNGEMWVEILRTSGNPELVRRFEEIEQQAQDLADEIDASEGRATEKANQALQDAKDWAEAEDALLKQEIDGAIEIAEQAKQDAIDKANQALTDAKDHAIAQDTALKSSIQSEIDTVGAEAEAAKQEAIKAYDDSIAEAERLVTEQNEVWQGKMEGYDEQVALIDASATDAQTKADQALEKAGISTDLAQTAKDLADTAKDNAQTALDNAASAISDSSKALTASRDAESLVGTAMSDASQALSEAQVAQANSLDALGKADNALDGVSNLDFRVDEVEGELELKADNTYMTEDGELITLSNAITLNAHRFSSDMSRIESRVESLAGEINLVILRDAFKGAWITANSVYPNTEKPTTAQHNDTMRELIEVTSGEQLAFSKNTVPNDNHWRINFYGSSNNYISRTAPLDNQFVLTVPSNVTKMWVSYPQGSQPQIIRGTEFIPYRPNIADQMTTDEVTIFRNEYDEFADKTVRRLTAIDSEDGRLSTAEALISQNAEAIEARLTRNEIETLVDGKGLVNATYVNNQIDATADGITNEITRVEGKIPQNYTEENLVLNSKVYISNQNYMIREYTLSKQLVVGKEYTIVLDGGIGTNGTDQLFGIFFDNAQSGQGTLQFAGGGIYKKTFTLLQTGPNSGDKSKFRLYNIPNPNNSPHSTINWIKLVEGSVTDNTHTPSMSDLLLQNDFTVYKKTTDDSIKAINTELSKTAKKTDLNGMVTETVLATKEFVTAGSMSTTLENYAQTNAVPTNNQFNELKNSYDSMVQTIGTNGNKIAQMVMTDSLFKTEVIKNVPSAIGGRNYVLKSNEYYYTTNYKVAEYDLSTIPKGTKIKISLWGGLGSTVRTFGVYVNNSSGTASGNSQIIELAELGGVFGQGVASPLAKWTAEATLNVDAKKILIFGLDNNNSSPKRIEYVQIETGAYYTDWTAAPEDKADQSQVTQLAGSWALTLKSGGDIKSQINATTDGIRLEGKLIHLSGDTLIDEATIKSADIEELEVNKLTGTEADFVTLVAKGIITDTITAEHIKSEEALIDVIFSDRGKIDYLWNKQIWSEKISAIEIEAGQITSGTIDSAIVNAVDIVTEGLTADVIKSDYILADELLVDKVFSNKASVDKLWAKAIWTNKITAMEIDASQITAGEIETARLKVTDIVSQGLSGNEESITNLVIGEDVFTSSVTNLAKEKVADELKQEYETVTSKVNVVDGGRDSRYGESYPGGRFFYFNSRDGYVQGILFSGTTYTLEFSMQPNANKGTTVLLQVKHHDTESWVTLHTVKTTAGTQVNTFTFKNDTFVNSVSDYRLAIHNVDGYAVSYIWGFRLYEEVEVEVPVTSSETGAISSKITQLYDMINLSVLGKEGALSRIAMGEEGIQIDGKLLHITAKTYIDDAVITDAMIGNLDAGKITTGELNANNVSIVNLDVNNLTGNAFNFVKGAFASSSSRVSITGNGMDIVRNDGSRVIGFDDQGIDITGSSGKKMGHIGHLADGGYGEETVGVSGAYDTDLILGYQHTAGTTYTPAIKIAKNTGSIRVTESTTFGQPVYMNGAFYLGDIRIVSGTGKVGGVNTATLAFPHSGGQLRIANGDLYIKSSSGSYYSFVTLWNKVFS